jgi:hypothetical protein
VDELLESSYQEQMNEGLEEMIALGIAEVVMVLKRMNLQGLS